MNRKVLITAVSILAVMFLGIAALMFVLFRGENQGKKLFPARQDPVLCAVPSNAVAVARFRNLQEASSFVLSKDVPPKGVKGRKNSFEKTLADSAVSGAFPRLSKNVLAVSFHYARNLVPLYLIDAGRSGDTDYDAEVEKISAIATASGYVLKDCDCSTILSVNELLRKRRILLLSPSVSVINSSLRHLNDGVSVYDSDGFAAAASKVSSDSRLYVDISSAGQISKEILDSRYDKMVKSVSGFSDWAAFSLDFTESSAKLNGTAVSNMDTDLVRVFASLSASSSSVCEILPASTLFALSIPLDSVDDFSEAFDRYLDGRMKLSDANKLRKSIKGKNGMAPLQWFKSLNPSEVAAAWFVSKGKLRSVNLIRAGRRQNTDTLCRNYSYSGALKALFGEVFERRDESWSCFCNGWIVSGDRESVSEFSSGNATSYTLGQKLEDASLKGEIPSSAALVAYFSVDQDFAVKSSFKDGWKRSLEKALEGADMMPAFLTLEPVRKSMPEINLSVFSASLQRTQVPSPEQEMVEIKVPSGPFTVKNSDTGRNNLFVQNKNLSLSLKEENGKGIWTVPFKTPVCGSVVNVDMYGNGRLQFLFASGSSIYIIDRKGRYVSPYPVDLGREILLGPAVYGKSGNYELIILHNDNSIVKYGLDGKVASAWQEISPDETIISLPERIVAGSKVCWAVRTARQTLIYPENGGKPLSNFKGNAVFRSDAGIKVEDDGVISAQSYDGKVRKLKI
ncbi:MAG: hypothetical protein ACI39U_02910 [Candidatus Cryptobacteroides sp.]